MTSERGAIEAHADRYALAVATVGTRAARLHSYVTVALCALGHVLEVGRQRQRRRRGQRRAIRLNFHAAAATIVVVVVVVGMVEKTC